MVRFQKTIRCSLTAPSSRSADQLACGSSLKFCRLAEGQADVYPRLAPTSEWDIAAGHAVLTASGGVISAPGGAPLAYGRAEESFRIQAFVAWADPAAITAPGS